MEVWHVLSATFAGLCAGLIGVALARLPRTTISVPLYAFVGSAVLWAVGDPVATAATGMAWKHAGLLLLYTGSITMPALWWIVALRWAEEEHAALPLRHEGWTRLPLAFAFVMWVVMVTNPLHGAFMTPVVDGRNVYQPFWYLMAIPNYCLILGALAVEVEVARRVARRYVRRQAAFLVAASLVTLVGNALYVSNLVPLNLSPLVLAASGALLLVGMAREGLFGVVPLALPAIAEDHPDGLIIVGPEGHVRLANGRAHALLSPVDLPPHALFAETLRDERLRPAASGDVGEAGRDPWDALTRPGGVLYRVELDRPRWLLLSARSVSGPRGDARGYCVHINDLTSQKEAELQEHQTRRLESVADLTRTLSRQFQGAFAIVHANAEMLQDDSKEGPAFERKLTRILEAARYGSSVAQDLQLYTGSVNTRRVLLELSEVVEESCDLVESEIPPPVRLSFARDEELLPVYVDAIQLRHSIFNVLTNAIESMAERAGEIRVSTGDARIDPSAALLVWGCDEPKGDFAYVRVRDEGGGMDARTEERAFEPFFSSRHKDRGNGLSTVLGIARAHGALVALENEPGQGCEFTLYFPLERNAGSA